MASSRRAGAAALAIAAACAGSGLADRPPRPEAVEPAWGYSDDGAEVVVRGSAFHARPVQDVSGQGGDRVDARFHAWIGGVELQEVRWIDATTLRARVPPGLPAGVHGVEVEGPWGTRGSLEAAYEVFPGSGPRLSVASVGVDPATASVGQRVAVTVTVANAGGSPAAAVLSRCAAQGTGAVDPVGPAPAAAAVPAGGTAPFTHLFDARTAGPVTFAVDAAGVDPNTGGDVAAAPHGGSSLAVEDPPALSSAVSVARTAVTVGGAITLDVTVANAGEAVARGVAVSATPSMPGVATLESATGPQDVAPGAPATYQLVWRTVAAGAVTFAIDAAGADENGAGAVSAAPVDSAALEIQTPPDLRIASATTDATRYAVGQQVTLTVELLNAGQATAAEVIPAATAPPFLSLASAPVVPRVIAGGGRDVLTWTFAGAAIGTGSIAIAASGVDANDGTPVGPAERSTGEITVASGPLLAATLTVPTFLPVGQFTVTLVVRNVGGATASEVHPGPLVTVPGDTTAAILIPSTSFPEVDLPPGGEARFEWTCTATSTGTARFQTTAYAEGSSVSVSATSNLASVGGEVAEILPDPFGDAYTPGATPFAHVFRYRGRVYLGPGADGTGVVRARLDGGVPEAVGLAFAADVTGNVTRNAATPYRSIGFTGCTPDVLGVLACGPDEEGGRALWTSFLVDGREWLLASGARAPAAHDGLDYVYMTAADAGASIPFSYVDLSVVLGSDVRAVSSVVALGQRVYVGFADTGPKRPQAVVLSTMPGATGLDATSADVQDLGLSDLYASPGGFTAWPALAMVDAMTGVGGRLHVFSIGGCLWAKDDPPTSWARCTPNDAEYAGSVDSPKVSVAPTRAHDLEPEDRAFPAAVAWNGRLLLLRNTTAGPQIWYCVPGQTGDAGCDPDDWGAPGSSVGNLVGRNTAASGLDGSLSQLDDPANHRVTLLAATDTHLYVGFNRRDPTTGDPLGVRIYRTSSLAPAVAGDFVGAGGCSAASASCEGLGGDGLGRPEANVRILDARTLSFNEAEGVVDYLYVAAGGGTDASSGTPAPVRVYRVDE